MSDGKSDDVFDALDALGRARREALRPDEARDLEHALTTSALVRTAHEVGRSFDEQSVVRAGDDTLIARAATAALAKRPRHVNARTRWLLGVAATWLVGTAAAASVAVVVARGGGGAEVVRRLPAAPSKSQAKAHGSAPAAARGETAPDGAPHAETPPNGAAQTETPPNGAEPPRAHAVRSPEPAAHAGSGASASGHVASALEPAPDLAPPPLPGPAELFREASAARRAGDLVRARALYTELQARFPHTSEARVSLVSLGTLLLAAGRASEAEAAFGAYLGGGRGDLTEEALVGRAGACAALGRSADERRAWSELVERFPTSVYVARAKARLGALDPASHASSGTR